MALRYSSCRFHTAPAGIEQEHFTKAPLQMRVLLPKARFARSIFCRRRPSAYSQCNKSVVPAFSKVQSIVLLDEAEVEFADNDLFNNRGEDDTADASRRQLSRWQPRVVTNHNFTHVDPRLSKGPAVLPCCGGTEWLYHRRSKRRSF